MLARGCQS
jgi:flagellar biosynthesis GTPase FlhF